MAAGDGIVEGAPFPQLFKTSNVVKQTTQPSEANIFIRPTLGPRNFITKFRNLIGMLDLESNANIIGSICVDIRPKDSAGVLAHYVRDN